MTDSLRLSVYGSADGSGDAIETLGGGLDVVSRLWVWMLAFEIPLLAGELAATDDADTWSWHHHSLPRASAGTS